LLTDRTAQKIGRIAATRSPSWSWRYRGSSSALTVDRLGRSLQDLITFLGELHSTGIDLFLKAQGLDTSTPAGKAMFQ
jgi:hypothetical protein